MMNNKENNFVSAVIYVHNAEKRIGSFLKSIIEVMENNFEYSEIICVNDFSEDNSLEAIRLAGSVARTVNISIVNMSYFHGLELSMNAGADLSIGDFVFEFDNTYLDYEISVIMEIYYRALQGYDVVSASPDRRQKVASRFFYAIFSRAIDVSYKMNTESFRVLSRRVINRISSMNKMVIYRKALYANCGLKTDTIKYPVLNTKPMLPDKNEKKFRYGLAIDSLILFTNLGYSISKIMTVLMLFLSIFMGIYSAVIYITSNPVAGWSTTILFLSAAFTGLFLIMTIVIKYLQLLIDITFKRKHYCFESVEKLTK